MSVIEAAMIRCRTMADGSLRIECEVSPIDAQAAFALFGAPGRAIALAALKDGSAAVKEPEPEKPKGGEWAKMAGMWCADPDFWRFLNETYPEHGYIGNELHAADAVRFYSGHIASRAELDSDRLARAMFHGQIRQPFMAWMKANGISK